LRLKTVRTIVLSAITLVAFAVIGVAALFWRLNQGPVSLSFMQQSMEQAVNRQLPGLRIKLGDAVLELDSDSGIPHVRTRNLELYDEDGTLLASAPKAGVALDGTKLIRGQVVINSLELIGPRINARRNLDGGVQLGIGLTATDESQEVVIDDADAAPSSPGKQSRTSEEPATDTGGSKVLNLLASTDGKGALSNLDDIRITRASIRLYDEANDSTWYAPRADLSFRRTPYGFVIVTKASVASGGAPWNVEAIASFKTDARNFAITVNVADFVPANVADEIYGLAQFARLKMPFSGRFDLDVTAQGQLTRATGELQAAAGEISLPDYLAKPIQIDEGLMKLSYETSEDVFYLRDSAIVIGGATTAVEGKILPQRTEDGRLSALRLDMVAKSAPLATGQSKPGVDRIEFKGDVAMEQQRVSIDDLVVMSGNTGVRLRGVITGGEESSGIQVAGRLRDVSADLLKEIWPPILAPRTRGWINDNVQDGRITEGTFQVNFPQNALAQAMRDQKLPPNSVDVNFTMNGVSTRYFKTMPVLTGASGKGELRDGTFTLDRPLRRH
jgi:Protein of unknown function